MLWLMMTSLPKIYIDVIFVSLQYVRMHTLRTDEDTRTPLTWYINGNFMKVEENGIL